MSDLHMPLVLPGDKVVSQIKQVTITADDEISKVNALLAEGWQLLSIGCHSGGTVYVLGHAEERAKQRPGFVMEGPSK